MNKYAVIDIGSNAIHLDLFGIKRGKPYFLEEGGTYNKLGRYLSRDGKIPKTKITESILIIKRLIRQAKRVRVKEILIFGTSILRKAKNRKTFLEAVKKECGLTIDVMSADRESRYVASVANKLMKIKKTELLVDIGGGSTELVLLNQKKTFARKSYPYGLSKTKEKFKVRNFSNKKQELQILNFFERKIELFRKLSKQKRAQGIIGFSSVVKTFAMIKYSGIRTPRDFSGKQILARDLKNMKRRLESGRSLKRVSRRRRDLVYLGVLFLRNFFKSTKFQNYA